MNQAKKNEILNTMIQLGKEVDEHLDSDTQERGKIAYYKDFKFGNSGLGVENVYTVETLQKKEHEIGDKREENQTIYEIYDEDCNLIATVTEDGKVHFMPEYLEELKQINPEYFEQLKLEDINFEQPEELREDDIIMTKAELEEQEQGTERSLGGEKQKEEKEDKQEEQETEEAKKEEAAEALGIKSSEIRSVCTINPREKITNNETLADIMPETKKYDEIRMVCSNPNEQSHGRFTIIGTSKNGETKKTVSEPLTSIEPVEGTSTGKDVISVNEDGSQVTEKQVQGLFRINSRGRTDGISVSLGDYGMMNLDYISNVMDKEHRRATPIRTKGPENVRVATASVRENAGDSIEEVEKEGRIFRAKEEDGVDPQSLDGIDTDMADGGNMTLEELKEYIKDQTLEQGDMSKAETREFIRVEITKSGLELSDGEIEHTTDEIEEAVIDESRFGERGHRE